MMRPGELIETARAPRTPGQGREGLAYALRTPEIALALLMLTITRILAYEFPITLPLLATDANGATGAMAAGAIVGGLIAAARTTPRHSSGLTLTAIGCETAITAA